MQSLINHIVRGQSRLQIFQTLKILPTRLSWSRKIPSTFLTWLIDCAAVSNMWLVWLYIDNMCVTIHVKIAIFTLTCDRLFSFSSSAKVQSLALNNVRPSREWEEKKERRFSPPCDEQRARPVTGDESPWIGHMSNISQSEARTDQEYGMAEWMGERRNMAEKS